MMMWSQFPYCSKIKEQNRYEDEIIIIIIIQVVSRRIKAGIAVLEEPW